jgi:hypothetical protein
VLSNGVTYTLTLTVTGANLTETTTVSNFNNSGAFGSGVIPLNTSDFTFVPASGSTTNFVTARTTTTFSMKLKCNSNSTNTANVKNILAVAISDFDIDAFAANSNNSKHCLYKLGSLSNSGTSYDLAKVRAGQKLPDLTPVLPALTLFKPDPANSNSFQGQSNLYKPLVADFCGLTSGLQSTSFTDGTLTGREFSVALGTSSYGVSNIGVVGANINFDIKIDRFANAANAPSGTAAVLMNTSMISAANFPPVNITRSVSFTRPTVKIYTIDGKAGCYLRRVNESTPDPNEEGAYKVSVDYRCFLLNQLGGRTQCLSLTGSPPTDNVKESREDNNVSTKQ